MHNDIGGIHQEKYYYIDSTSALYYSYTHRTYIIYTYIKFRKYLITRETTHNILILNWLEN